MINNYVVTKDIKDNFKEQMRFVFDSIKDNLEFGDVHNSDDHSDLFDEMWQNSNLAKLMIYFLYNDVVSFEERIDCDVSFEVIMNHLKNDTTLLNGCKSLVLEKQEYAGKTKIHKHRVFIDGKEYSGDTLTSLWTPIKLWISNPNVYEKVFSAEERLLEFENNKYCVSKDNRERLKNQLGKSLTYKGIWAAFILENLTHFEKLITNTMNYVIGMYHTQNNFLLVPEFFNTGSAGRYACNDFADLKLNAIYSYFKTGNMRELEYMFSDIEEYIYVAGRRVTDPKKTKKKKEDTLSATLTWLDKYSDWESFVKSNRLLNHIDETGKPIELWENHERGQIPNVAQLEQLFDNMEKILVKTNDETGCIH